MSGNPAADEVVESEGTGPTRARSEGLRVCFVGTARISRPLDATTAKKFRALSAIGAISVIAFSNDARIRTFQEHATFRLLPNIRPAPARYALALVAGTLIATYEILRGTHVLVAQGPLEGFPAAAAKSIARVFGRRVGLILESHGDYDASLSLQRTQRFPRVTRAVIGAMARFSGRRADVLRAVSRFTADQICTLAPTAPLVVFPAWTDLQTFLRAGAVDRRREPVIVYAGVIIPGRGLHHLIRSFSVIAPEFPDVRLELIGAVGNATYARKLRHAAADLGLSGRVHFLPRMSQDALADRIAAASVFAFPTHSEGLGRVIFEAMAAATPVVASRVGGVPELITDRSDGYLVPPGDETSLANTLREILSNPQQARQVATAARHKATDVFSTEKYIAGYTSAFSLATRRVAVHSEANAP